MQRTIAQPVRTSGIGLHSGKPVQMTLSPAPAGYGIVFRRSDLSPVVDIKISPEGVRDTMLCTGLENAEGIKVFTVEHLMSALCGMGVDNIRIDLDAPEVPIFDGSAAPFLFLLENAGIAELDEPKKIIKIMRRVEVRDGDKVAILKPDDKFIVDLEVDFHHPIVPRQRGVFEINGDFYRQGISRARTFCFQGDVEKMQQAGLALGGGLDNAIVIGDFSVLNQSGLRYEDEFLRHKVLDCIGDLYMAGYPILGKFKGSMTGHGMNNRLLQAVLADPINWRFIEAPAESDILPLAG